MKIGRIYYYSSSLLCLGVETGEGKRRGDLEGEGRNLRGRHYRCMDPVFTSGRIVAEM